MTGKYEETKDLLMSLSQHLSTNKPYSSIDIGKLGLLSVVYDLSSSIYESGRAFYGLQSISSESCSTVLAILRKLSGYVDKCSEMTSIDLAIAMYGLKSQTDNEVAFITSDIHTHMSVLYQSSNYR